jgi:hypothetical protein
LSKGDGVATFERAFHLRTGTDTLSQLADEWLATHATKTDVCSDAYGSCAFVASEAQPSPDIALFGITWLTRAEAAIVDYARRAWPDSVIVTYGRGSNCQTVVSLAAALAASVEHAIQPARSALPAIPPDGIGPDSAAPESNRLSAAEIAVLLDPELR